MKNRSIETIFKVLSSAQVDLTLTPCEQLREEKRNRSSFSNTSCNGFNFVDFHPGRFPNNLAYLIKEMIDSYKLQITIDQNYEQNIKELRFTNASIFTWEDYWVEIVEGKKILIDPKIEIVNLQKNALLHANFNLPRPTLKTLILEDNPALQAVFVTDAPNLEILNISNCPSLQLTNLGFNGKLKTVLARNNNLSEFAQESLLGAIRPIQTTTSNQPEGGLFAFKKHSECVIDLRGSEIVWNNRRIASKIRLLLTNNWMVLWDNTPPTSIVPPQYYSFFSHNLEEKLLREYYG